MSDHYVNGPVWNAFGLSRAGFLVLPRRALQSMPLEWQKQFVEMCNQLREACPAEALDGNYQVMERDISGRLQTPEIGEYRHTGPLYGMKESPASITDFVKRDIDRIEWLSCKACHTGDGVSHPRKVVVIACEWKQTDEQPHYPGLRAAIDQEMEQEMLGIEQSRRKFDNSEAL